MTMIPETDQWKLDADCPKCRRQPYCKQPCTQSTRLARKHMAELWEKAIKEHLEKMEAEKSETSEEKDE